jgi:Methyltransferase domain
MAAEIDSSLLDALANEEGLFHVTDEGRRLSRSLTGAPLQALRSSLRPGMRTLETGCGGTTVVFAASGTRHTVVTPDVAEIERVRAFCADHGIATDEVEFRAGSSDRELVGWTEPLDLFLIDGAHRMPYPLLDWHYGARSLRVGGRLFLDDVPIPAVHVLYDFLRKETEWELEAVHGDKLAVFRKVAEPSEDGTLDWELQRYNLPWSYGHIPLRRRWRKARDWAMLGTRWRRRRGT